ncbi:DUF3592 domain-containing protein [Roseomonas rosulenta]|uniref:DUF3592 domain-containing protein n=1 Tax=Roseomonas rosulenta TaxID=2748667 RepID=UPI0018DF4A93|nr:DUF3592 domain-containing protein [Roseomonas rosulenta]
MQVSYQSSVAQGGRVGRIVAWIFLPLGLALLAGGGYAAWREVEFRRGAIETDGRVVEMRSRIDNDRNRGTSRTYAPVFTFALPSGKLQRVEAGIWSNPPCCTVGEAIRVRYRPEAPERAQMTGFMESWFVATLLGGMGLVFTLVGTAVLRVARPGGPGLAMAPPGAPGMAMPQAGVPPNAMTFAVPLVGMRRQGGACILQARWADPRSGVQRLFESPPIPFDPVPQMRSMTSVQVTFDPGMPDGPYAMDLSFLREPDADATVVQRRG